ncbi:restriction endonuclease subunit S [Fictibacillus barbaricus]|uniref:Restriction endonuclease S subunit n=1 Tax=Fictibacillus barbaricus TaxID=182136 RepID=A0ABU1U446_9BACL|nr:restriction endonuclease subunit S [Fictibacillus barbaricus]MDR7074161.1 restriction endonuclease S subunit [Fictibacillus barbaricus]
MTMMKVVPYEILENKVWSINSLLTPVDNNTEGTPLTEWVNINPEKLNRKNIISNQLYSYIDLSAVSAEKGVIVNSKQILGEDLPTRASLLVKEGDIILSTVRPERNLVAIIEKEYSDSIVNNSFVVLRPKQGTNISSLLYFILRSTEVRRNLISLARGTAVPTIKISDLSLIHLPFLELDFNKVDRARDLYDLWFEMQTQIKPLEAIIEDIFVERGIRSDLYDSYSENRNSLYKVLPYGKLEDRMDVCFLMTPPIEKQWSVQTLSLDSLANFRSGAAIPAKEYQENGVPYVRIKNLNESSILLDDMIYVKEDFSMNNPKAVLNKGNIIISRVGTIGKAALVDQRLEGSIANQHITIVESNSEHIIPEYLNFYLQTPWAVDQLMQKASGAAQQFIKLRDIKDLQVPVPTLQEQQTIVNLIKKAIKINSDDQLEKDIQTFTNELVITENTPN